jgi:hypothetical protein
LPAGETPACARPDIRSFKENDNNAKLLDKAIAKIEAATDSPTLVDLKDFKSRP